MGKSIGMGNSIGMGKSEQLLNSLQHPLQPEQIFSSFGGHFSYRVVGSCCRLFDREELPWPCCRLQWRGKEPSWRRIGKRFTPDLAVKNSPSYAVEILGQDYAGEPFVLTLYSVKLPASLREWWYSKKGAIALTTASTTCGAAEASSTEG